MKANTALKYKFKFNFHLMKDHTHVIKLFSKIFLAQTPFYVNNSLRKYFKKLFSPIQSEYFPGLLK